MNDFDGMIAMDVVCIESSECLKSTDFYVEVYSTKCFEPKCCFLRDRYPLNDDSNPRVQLTCKESNEVVVYCNQRKCSGIKACIDNGLLKFIEGSGQAVAAPSDALLREFNMHPGCNNIQFRIEGTDMKADCSIWLWGADQKIIIADIDGTITISDVRGYIETVFLNRYMYTHDGVVDFLNHIVDQKDTSVIYLTSRPVRHLQHTKKLLQCACDGNVTRLPNGPLFLSTAHPLRAMINDVVWRSSGTFKASMLHRIAECFPPSPSHMLPRPFLMGLGNRPTDAWAYLQAGIKADNVLIVNTQSRLSVWGTMYDGYTHSGGSNRRTGAHFDSFRSVRKFVP